MIVLLAVVAAPLPMQPPPPPVPYPGRSTHPAPTRAAVAFEMKHFAAISTAFAELVAVTKECSFKAPAPPPGHGAFGGVGRSSAANSGRQTAPCAGPR